MPVTSMCFPKLQLEELLVRSYGVRKYVRYFNKDD